MNMKTMTMGVGGVVIGLAVLTVLNVAASMIYTTDSMAVAATPAVVETVVEETAAEEVVAEVVTEEVAEEVVEVAQATTEEATEEAAEEAEEEAEEGGSFADMVANGDIKDGEKVFNKCKVCHKLEDGAKAVGPHLFAVVDRLKNSVEGFKYSPANLALTGDWTIEDLNAYLTKPKDFAPGTKMTFPGVKDEEDRANLIAFLLSLQ